MKILKDKLKLRIYQEKILNECIKSNSLVVLPTGLGKTMIALAMSMFYLNKNNKGFILFLAPTKPLIEQHNNLFSDFFNYTDNELLLISGQVNPDKRKELYKNVKIIFSTPQTIQNDLITKRLNLSDCLLLIFDECHRGIGEYAYTFISQVYKAQREKINVLGLSASPGSDKDKIIEVCNNLHLDNIIYKSENDADVKPYIKKKDIELIELLLPKELDSVKKGLEKSLKKRLDFFKQKELIHSSDINKINKRTFLAIQSDIGRKVSVEPNASHFEILKVNSEILKIFYCLELLQTQGVKPLIDYFQNLKKNLKIKSNSQLFKDSNFRDAVLQAFDIEDKIEHPKYEKVKELILNSLNNSSKAIIFTQYRNTASRLVEFLKSDNINPVLFVGQAGKEGLSQKKQIEIINDFEKGVYNVLVATSVAEEGLHIPSVDIAIFFEPVPSGLRMIQRRGRVGRVKFGRVIVLYTKGCIDEKYLFVSRAKEKRMKYAISDAKEFILSKKQKGLGDFF